MSISRTDISFRADGNVSIGGWLFLPEGTGPHPAITMCAGFGGTIHHGLEPFAVAFAEAGFASCCTTTAASAAVAESRARMSIPGARSPTGGERSPTWRAGPRSTRRA